MSRVEGRGRGSRSRVKVEGKKNVFSRGKLKKMFFRQEN